MFCKECGTHVDAGIRFCSSCGSEVGEVQSPPERPAANHKKVGMIACAAVLLVVIIGVIAIFGGRGGSAEAVVIRYMEASLNGDYRTVSRYMAFDMDTVMGAMFDAERLSEREFWDEMYEDIGVRNRREFFAHMADELDRELRNEFGRDYEMSFEVINDTPMRTSDKRRIIEELEFDLERWGYDVEDLIRLDRITEMAEYEIEMTISGRNDEVIETILITMVRIGGNWRVLGETGFYHPSPFLHW